MENYKINLKCPLCPGRAYDHTYKTYAGFYRHVFLEHTVDRLGRPFFGRDNIDSEEDSAIAYLRKWVIKYSVYVDYPVHGKAHVEAIIEGLIKKKFNPSLREIRI